jgi:hypothetical protein
MNGTGRQFARKETWLRNSELERVDRIGSVVSKELLREGRNYTRQ